MLIWMCALHCEAKPVIDFYRLKKSREARGFDLFTNDQVACVISGIGQLSMAAACGWAAATLAATNRCWINLGVAGQRELEIGTAVSVNQISTQDNTRSVYPVPILRPGFISRPLISITQESTDYHPQALYDMEAWGFATTLARFYSLEGIQCVKIVSDNQHNPPLRDKAQISALIERQLPIITDYAQSLHELLDQTAVTPQATEQLQTFLSLAHFSVTEQSQLARLMPALIQYESDLNSLLQQARAAGNAPAIINLLSQRLAVTSSKL